MKKIIKSFFVLIVFVFLTACEINIGTDITKKINYEDYGVIQLSKNELDLNDKTLEDYPSNCKNSINQFAYNTMKELVKENFSSEDKNNDLFYSPASFYMALSMLTEGANGTTYDELINLLNIASLDDLKKTNSVLYKNNHFKNDEGKVQLANSLWMNNSIKMKEEYIKNLIDNYYAESFQGAMDQTTIEAIAKWVNKNTFDFLKLTGNDLTDLLDNAFVLVNTIYFNNKWLVEFKEDNIKDMAFNNGTEQMIPFMYHQTSGNYYDLKAFTYATDDFYNGYKISYVLPKDNYSINDCFKGDDLENIIHGNMRIKYETIDLYVPKFKYQNKLDLVQVAKALGVNEVFTDNADLSKQSDTPLFVSTIFQIAGISLTEEGVEAAAATFIGEKEASAGPVEAIKFVLDKPFLYYITDANGAVLFMGVCLNPKTN